MKYTTATFLIALTIIGGGATTTNAQIRPSVTTGTGASSANTNAALTGSVYNPVSSSDTKKTFSGVSFSSVGGAIAGCANAGGLIVGGVTNLFNSAVKSKSDSAASQAVPTTDTNSTKELKTANRITQCLNGVAYSIAKNLLRQVSNRTLNWVNKGLGGNPLYVQDVASNLRTIRDEQLGRYLQNVQTSNPIFGNAIRSAVTQQVTGLSDGYLGVAMNTPQARQYQAFQQDFTNGGWNALLNMNNNPLGAFFASTDSLNKTITAQQTERTNEIQRNNGFLDMKTCVEYAPVKLSGSGICKDNGIPVDELPPDTPCVSGVTTDPSQTAAPQCLRYKTVTPGALIGQQVGTVLNSPTKQLEMADSINEVLGAFFDQLLSKLYQNGLAGLQTRTSGVGNSVSYGSNVVLGTNGQPINTFGGSFGYQTVGSGYDVQDFDISRPQQLRAILQAQYDFVNRARDSKIAMDTIVPTLGALDYCIPGPNPTWTDGLNDNYGAFIGSLYTPVKGSSTFAKILSSLLGSLLSGLFGNDKEIQYALAGQPTLIDKTTGEQVEISPWSYLYYTKDYDRGVKNTDGDWIRNWVNDGYNRIIQKYQQNFTQAAVTGLFTAVDPNTTYATGAIKDSLKETAKLASYNQTLAPLDDGYTEAISNTEDAITELEDIRAEALAIVKIAKARYIRERAAAGNPVDMTCINNAYVINESPVTGVARQESDTVNPMVQKSKEASDYFYSHL